MAEYTQNYHLRKLGPGQAISDESYKFADEDRDLIDHLLHHLENHHHTGAAASTFGTPLDPPDLTLLTSGGVIPAGTRVFYKVALVDPDGFETAASTEAFVDTAAAIALPAAAALELATTGGALLPGNYWYVLTAYYPLDTQETPAGTPAYIPIPAGSTNEVILHFPLPPVGASGYNIYRQRPGASSYHYLASVPIVGGATPANYTDDGSVVEDPDRRPPSSNATQSSNSVTVDLPVAVTPLPDGWTWRVYRTYLANNYDSSLLHWVVEETFEGSGIITTTYTDAGAGGFQGHPLALGQQRPGPPKVSLAGLADVTGTLPLAGVHAFPFIITFAIVGQVIVLVGKNAWVCEFPTAHIIGVRAVLGVGYMPDAQPVIIDVNKGSGIHPIYSTIYTTTGNRPRIAVGDQMGAVAAPDVASLALGDSLTVDIDQAGGGAGTDFDLTVNIIMLAQFTTTANDWSWS